MYAPEQGLFKAELSIGWLSGGYQAVLQTTGQTFTAGLGPAPRLLPATHDAKAPTRKGLSPVDYGLQLFQWVFKGELRDGFQLLRDLSQHGSDGPPAMRLLLRLDQDSSLTEFTWEAMCASPSEPPLGVTTAFSRYAPAAVPNRPTIWERPIRILLIVANPEGLQRFDLEAVDQQLERSVLQEAERQLEGGISVKRLPRARLEDIRREEREGYHITHLLAHATTAGMGGVVLADSAGKAVVVGLDALADAIASPSDGSAPYLAFLALPMNGEAQHGRILMELSGMLVRAGVQSVVVVQAPMEPGPLTTFMERFYSVLLDTGAVDVAAAEARKQLFFASPSSWDWTWPVLFSRSGDGGLQQRLPGPLAAAVSKITFGG